MPAQAASHVNSALAGFAVGGWEQEKVLRSLFPTVPVQFETDTYHIWDKATILRNEAQKMSATAKIPRGQFPTTTDTYTVDVVGFAWEIPVRSRANSDAAIKDEMDAGRNVGNKIGLAAEKIISTMLTGTTWTGATAIAAAGSWDTGAGTPIANVETQKLGILKKNGKKANVVVMGGAVYHWLRQHPSILERIGISATSGQSVPGAPGNMVVSVTQQTLASIFDVERVLVVNATHNTANRGATASYSFVMGDTVWVGYVPPSASTYDAPAGVLFQLANEYMQGEIRMRSWLQDDPEAVVIGGLTGFAAKATNLDAGALITDCLTTAGE